MNFAEKMSQFEMELEIMINRHSLENLSGTPDFILAGYLRRCLENFNVTIRDRAEWKGEKV